MHQRPSLVQIRHQRDSFARCFAEHAILQTEVAQRLLERLDYMRLNPSVILDLSAPTPESLEQLLQRYPDTEVVVSDFCWDLLVQQQTSSLAQKHLVCAGLEQIPLATESVDLIISNLSLAWLADPQFCFSDLLRVLKPGGLFLFTSLGPDTLQELRYAFSDQDQYAHVGDFIDMHHVGDALLSSGWQDPVMDMEVLTMAYDNLADLFTDLRVAGAKNLLANRYPNLMSRGRWNKMQARYEALQLENQQLPASFEIIYGHAWKPNKPPQNMRAEIVIPADSIKIKGE